ncbi:MAG TPA: GGDEF domain-containing protein [Nocardioides sp.]|nr:GGDEF domain-containing protein [Nocardioides sp.]
MTALRHEARETSGATTGGLLRYVRATAGEDAVAEVLERAGVPFTAEQLEDQSLWWSYDTRIRLFEAATEVLGDPDTMFKVGSAALHSGLAHSIVILLRAMGTPRQVFRKLPRAVAKFSTTSTMEVLDAGATSATVAFRLHEGFAHSRLDCSYAQGLLTTVPTVFGLPDAEIAHDECESDGHPACIYRLTWDRRSRLPRRRQVERSVDLELRALRGQLRILQSASTDLVASDDLDTVLHRIVARAAEAVLAPAYLLAVAAPGGGEPLVHSAGVPEDQVPGLAAALLAGDDLGQSAVVVEVASARRFHGRLAALYGPNYGAMGDESSMLTAYAGHAAAALDLIIALEDARQEADRAGALLTLAHELSATTDAGAVTDIVSEALPRIVGCTSAGILMWDPTSGCLRSHSSTGLSDDGTDLLQTTALHAEDVPELVGMLTDREPRIINRASSSPALQRLLDGVGTSDVVAVPLLAGTTFLGVATAGWATGEAPTQLDGDVLARLRGVGDQATTALQKARLLATVSHQATHDALTGLPNRVLFLERLVAAIPTAADGAHVAVLFCDLDRFKRVNDTLGHAAGDELLRQVAARLRGAVRPGDTVGRLSGDEFSIILPGLVTPEDAQSLADRVTACFAEPFRLDGTDVEVGTSVGVAVHAVGSDGTAEQLLREADAAMYRHKQGHRTSR